MPILFVSPAGAAAKVKLGTPAAMTSIAVPGLAVTAGIVITGISVAQSVRVAYFTTLSESIYIYPLGNKVGQCLLAGIAFPKVPCSSGSVDNYTNFTALLEFFRTRKASNFANITNPVTISIGSTTLTGFLEDIQLSTTSQEEAFGSTKFTLRLSLLPQD